MTEAGATRIVHGAATATREDGAWLVEVEFEGLEGLNVGLPKGLFPGRVVVQGSAEEASYLAELDALAEAEQRATVAELEREEELAQKEREADSGGARAPE